MLRIAASGGKNGSSFCNPRGIFHDSDVIRRRLGKHEAIHGSQFWLR